MKGASKKVKVRRRVQEAPKEAEEKEIGPKEDGDKQQINNDEPPVISENKEDVMVFEGLCERMLSAMGLLQTSVSEVLDVKDELILHNVPSCVQAQMSLSTSRLFRSLTDLYVPSTELVRLVRVFGPQWEQKRMILKQLQEEHERLQRLLSLALQRVQHLETQLHRDSESQHYKNWEKLFVRLMRMGPDITSPEMPPELDMKR
ncbi:PREDICTED: uncharacterized protein LOC108794166 [Nanorana parkeri]|uniref:uncharacterized protein LOC108794166 n=1 Tax=Nanorana parkeri TaxID=125878 RepID=UPI00085441E1|nr:PREDICTED: uncharacterized protein LOC108794166 [Nanorana parkeri]